MPDIANGREKVNAFLKEKGIKKSRSLLLIYQKNNFSGCLRL